MTSIATTTVHLIDVYRVASSLALAQLLANVSEKRQVRAVSHHGALDAFRVVLSELLVRLALGRVHDVPDERIQFTENNWGKPMLRESSTLEFNASHSGRWVICTIGDRPVGIDVENRKLVTENAVFSAMSADEIQRAQQIQCPTARLRHLTQIWTLKEAYSKAVGLGLHLPFDSVSVEIPHFGQPRLTSPISKPCQFTSWWLDGDHCVSLCLLGLSGDARPPLSAPVYSWRNDALPSAGASCRWKDAFVPLSYRRGAK